MGVNKKCPKCGSNKVQITSERGKHGCLWTVLFGAFYGLWWLCKLMFAGCVWICYDWWMAIIKKAKGKQHVFVSKRMIQNTTRTYYCNDCGYTFKG